MALTTGFFILKMCIIKLNNKLVKDSRTFQIPLMVERPKDSDNSIMHMVHWIQNAAQKSDSGISELYYSDWQNLLPK